LLLLLLLLQALLLLKLMLMLPQVLLFQLALPFHMLMIRLLHYWISWRHTGNLSSSCSCHSGVLLHFHVKSYFVLRRQVLISFLLNWS